MNIFYLDKDARLAAQYHNNKHCVKMIVESAQLLSTACREIGISDPILYKTTHKNHPSAVWTRSSVRHYIYTLELFAWLLYEYTYRYDKDHACSSKLDFFVDQLTHFPDNGWVDPPLCMPEECKTDDVVQSYRNYYKMKKSHFCFWTNRDIPDWYKL
jgi:hypothetical protein